MVHDTLGGGLPPFPVPPAFASVLSCHLRQSLGVNPPLLPYLDWGALLPPSTMLLFSAIAGELNSLLCTANMALTMGTWTESPARDHFKIPPQLVRVADPIIGFDLSMSYIAMTSATGGLGVCSGEGFLSPTTALLPPPLHCHRRSSASVGWSVMTNWHTHPPPSQS